MNDARCSCGGGGSAAHRAPRRPRRHRFSGAGQPDGEVLARRETVLWREGRHAAGVSVQQVERRGVRARGLPRELLRLRRHPLQVGLQAAACGHALRQPAPHLHSSCDEAAGTGPLRP